MPEGQEPIRVGSAAEFLSRTELTEIRTYFLQGERAERAAAEESKLSISARGDASWLEVLCRMALKTEDAELVVDRSAMFTHAEPLELGQETVREFIEKVGVMTVYPYLCESVFTLASNLGVSPPVMAFMRAGGIRVDELAGTRSQVAHQPK